MITKLLDAALTGLNEGLRLANTNASKRYADEVYQLKLEILEELQKGYEADDAKLGYMEKRLTLALEAARDELARARTN